MLLRDKKDQTLHGGDNNTGEKGGNDNNEKENVWPCRTDGAVSCGGVDFRYQNGVCRTECENCLDDLVSLPSGRFDCLDALAWVRCLFILVGTDEWIGIGLLIEVAEGVIYLSANDVLVRVPALAERKVGCWETYLCLASSARIYSSRSRMVLLPSGIFQ